MYVYVLYRRKIYLLWTLFNEYLRWNSALVAKLELLVLTLFFRRQCCGQFMTILPVRHLMLKHHPYLNGSFM